MTIEPVVRATDEVRALVGELEATLAQHYGPEQRHGLALDALFAPNVRLFIARLDEAAIGCCGVAFEADYAEVKRMFVRPNRRGRGVARALLARVEDAARERGFATLRLETGDRQSEALALYEFAGFVRRPTFGAYAVMSPEAIARSIFMEKTFV